MCECLRNKNKKKCYIKFLVCFRDVDQVHDMMDDIAEQQDVAKEISDAISNPVSFGII